MLIPIPASLMTLLGSQKTGQPGDPIAGYSSYRDLKVGETVAQYYSKKAKLDVKVEAADGTVTKRPISPQEAGRKALAMIGVLIIAALFWATGALPIGYTALLVGVIMYLFGVFQPNDVASSFFKDSVFFVMGVLAFAVGIGKTGLDKRIGLVLLGTSRSVPMYLFFFCPLLAITASFLSEHALVAFIVPLMMVVYMAAIRQAGLKQDRQLVVLFILALCFVANNGGPGSLAAGGRNAVMIGILADYNMAPTFGQWVKYGLPYVPVAALSIALYFFLVVYRKLKVGKVNVAAIVKKESEKIGRMTSQEYMTAAILVGVIVLWITASDALGMGGPVWMGLVAMAVLRIMVWRDVNKIAWDVVLLYGSATAMGAGLAYTGAALWMAQSFVDILPAAMSSGEGLAVASSLITGIMTNFMSDGATVAAVGPITVPMATISGTHPWMVGLATAFASSFANMLIIGTPNNAIAYSLARDLDTGEQLITLGDFFKHGLVVTLIGFAVLWGWTIFGYWQWIGF
jgi:sodium-dependent dicarboxylate transporter 2/3/5